MKASAGTSYSHSRPKRTAELRQRDRREHDVADDRGVFISHEGYEGPCLLAQQGDKPRFRRSTEGGDVDVLHYGMVGLGFRPNGHQAGYSASVLLLNSLMQKSAAALSSRFRRSAEFATSSS